MDLQGGTMFWLGDREASATATGAEETRGHGLRRPFLFRAAQEAHVLPVPEKAPPSLSRAARIGLLSHIMDATPGARTLR